MQSNKVMRTQSLNWPKQALTSAKGPPKKSSATKLETDKQGGVQKSEHNGANHRAKEALLKESRARVRRRVKKILPEEELDVKREFIVPQGSGPTHHGYKVAPLPHLSLRHFDF